ncbi:MAG: YbaN family protein [Dehalococcoidia bacterium]|nr:YbaN family protein [Dehalococcoidia bacterium]
MVGRLYVAAGMVCLGLGVLGAFLPLLPTTPFLLLAAACFARGSTKFYNWLINNRWFGRCIRDYREGRGIPKRLKVFTLLLLWVTIGCSAAFAVDSLLIRIILALIAVGVTAHILSIQTAKVERNPSGSLSGFHINSAGPDHLRQASTVEGENNREPGRGY